jgi:hypothetical protein
VSLLLGQLEASVDRVEVRFEDGSAAPAVIRRPWWIYLVGGEESEPGHRPDKLVALDGDGRQVASEQLDPRYFGRP